jgi:hypothetical protein
MNKLHFLTTDKNLFTFSFREQQAREQAAAEAAVESLGGDGGARRMGGAAAENEEEGEMLGLENLMHSHSPPPTMHQPLDNGE